MVSFTSRPFEPTGKLPRFPLGFRGSQGDFERKLFSHLGIEPRFFYCPVRSLITTQRAVSQITRMYLLTY